MRNPSCRATRKGLKDKLGTGACRIEENLTLNSNRLRTFEDARSEIVTDVGAKFG